MIGLQQSLRKKGPEGFGQLNQELKEQGNDPAEIIARYQRESKQ